MNCLYLGKIWLRKLNTGQDIVKSFLGVTFLTHLYIVYYLHTTAKATSQLITHSSHHMVISSLVNSSHMLLIPQLTHHKWAHNKAISCQ